MLKYLFMAFVFFVAFPQHVHSSFQDCQHDNATFKCVQFLGNFDGDTIKVNIPNIHSLLGEKINIRLADVDTPEMRSDTVCEAALAKQAKLFVYNALFMATRIDLYEARRGKYFRVIAKIVYDGKDLGQELLKKKLAVPYLGRKKPVTDWCPFFKAQAK